MQAFDDSAGRRPVLAVVTCYRHPDYVRAISLRAAAAQSGRFSVIVIKNRSRGVRRYAEVAAALWRLRTHENPPDAYLVTFRGYEILPVVLALARNRPVYYDEFINPVEWFVYEHRWLKEGSVPARMLTSAFRWMMRRTAGILTDTASHADFSAELMSVDRRLYHPVPVSTDEELFHPTIVTDVASGEFGVLYYGSMLPLHGVDIVLAAAVGLMGEADIRFHFVGGDESVRTRVDLAVSDGARIEYTPWVEYRELPTLFAANDLMLGGPFGDTVQSEFVITGKTYQFLASGLPTVIGENRESGEFSARVDALVVPRGDASALAEEIRWARDHRAALAGIGRAGRALYVRRFSVEHISSVLGSVILPEDPSQVEQAREAE